MSRRRRPRDRHAAPRRAQRAEEPLPRSTHPRAADPGLGAPRTRSSGSPRRISTASGAASSPRSSSGGRRRRGSTCPVPEAALSLDGSYLFVQGPPGSGKTWQGAKAAVALMRAGRRVGVTSLEPQGDLEAPRGDRARGARAGLRVPRPQEVDSRRRGAPASRGRSSTRADGWRDLLDEELQLVAGTSWLFARADFDRLPRHADRRRGGPGLARRRRRGRPRGAEPRPARRPEPAAAGLAGRDAGRGEGVRSSSTCSARRRPCRRTAGSSSSARGACGPS